MSINLYRKEVSAGVFQEFYQVRAEAVNKFTGKRIQKKQSGITSELKAQRAYKELWNQCRNDRPTDLQIASWLELRTKYLEYVQNNVRSATNPNGWSPKTLGKKRSLSEYTKQWNSMFLTMISPQFVIEQLSEFEKQGMKRTLTFEIQKEVKATFSYAVNLGLFPISPLEKLKKLKVPKKLKLALTHDEVRKLLFEAKKQNHPFYFIWVMTLATGLRRSELAGLRWSDVDFENRLVHVQRQIIPNEGEVFQLKDYEDRTVALPETIMPTLLEYHKRATTNLIIETSDPAWKNGNQAQVLGDFCDSIGIKRVTHHALRATHITLALADGVPTGIVKENVGHSKLSTTDGYYRRSGIQMKGRTDQLKIAIPSESDEIEHRQLKAL